MSRILSRAVAIPGTIILLALAAFPAAADEGAQTFIRTLAQKAVTSLTSRDMPQADRERAFRALLTAHFDVAQIGKWSLGRYWRVATPIEQQEYQALFEDYIVTTYSQRFREYTNEQLEVTDVVKAMDEDGGLVVHSHITRDQPKAIRVDWRLSTADGYKVVDVVVEGVSMVQTQRSEFSSVIVRGGNKVQSLLTELKLKTEQLRAQAN